MSTNDIILLVVVILCIAVLIVFVGVYIYYELIYIARYRRKLKNIHNKIAMLQKEVLEKNKELIALTDLVYYSGNQILSIKLIKKDCCNDDDESSAGIGKILEDWIESIREKRNLCYDKIKQCNIRLKSLNEQIETLEEQLYSIL